MKKHWDINSIYDEIIKAEQQEKADIKPHLLKTIDDYQVPSFNIPTTRQPKTDREKLSKVYSMVDMLKHVRCKDKCSVIFLATTSKKSISICGSH